MALRTRLVLVALVAMFATGLLQTTAGAAPVPSATTPNAPHIEFGSIPIETSTHKTVTVSLDAGFSFDSFDGTGTTFPFDFHSNCFGKTGPVHCQVEETFHPFNAGPVNAVTDIHECRAILFFKVCQTIEVTITGRAVSLAAAKPAELHFGSVPIETNATLHSTITVDNGYRIALINGTGTTFPFSHHTTCFNFRGPGHCVLDETYAPINAVGSGAVTHVFECPERGGTCLPIDVFMTGNAVSTFAAKPTFVGFGFVGVGRAVTRSVTLTIDAAHRVIDTVQGGGTVAPYSVDLGRCTNFRGPGTCRFTEGYHPTSESLIVTNLRVFECPERGGICTPIDIGIGGRGIPR